MKFAHLADCHVGGWRDPLLTELSIEAFEQAINIIFKEEVDFIVIAGDLFNTSLPGIDKIKRVAAKFKQLKDAHIPIYFIAGSHDYSPSGKTMLDVLEHAGLARNVSKAKEENGKLCLQFTQDPKTGVKLAGILGRMGSLDKGYYQELNREQLESEPGEKIFLFHALLSELKPKELENVDTHPLSLLPKGFNYYAGGHPHFVFCQPMKEHGIVAYTGPLFPNSFSELEELGHGGFFIVEDWKPRRIDVKLKDVEKIKIDAEGKDSHAVAQQLEELLEEGNFQDKIVLIRMEGMLAEGKPSDIDLRKCSQVLKDKGAFCILRNTAALTSKEFAEIKVDLRHVQDIEDSLIREHLREERVNGQEARKLAVSLMSVLDAQRMEGERVADFEARLTEEIKKVISSHMPSE
ncbi:exonuclease SbcCD subunit D [Candidatus Woesearchaeota archaeon]|nr:exonuclease SbcCD subunit D [Candidatus Woesearchaeota archaeon]